VFMRINGNFSFRRSLKEYYDYSLISTCKESSRYFLRNDCDCKVVYPYKARKKYTVTESLDLIDSVK
jgi:hypothetical protein